ncbi:MAG TPA: alpha/beta hydrolase [Vicinamibacterales bacterium]|nr:alpha/beta hydrolase [Vicinamibacterales bacterium]
MAWTLLLVVPIGVAAAGLIYQGIGAARDRRRFGVLGSLTSVGRHRLHVRCEGAGSPTVVLEAGIAASSLTWSRVQPAVASETRVCSYDRAGLAWSEGASTSRSIDVLVSELRALLTHAAIPSPYVLVAHSFGALIIRAFARAHPKRTAATTCRCREVAGLVFVDPLHPAEWCDPAPNQRRMLRGGIFLSRVGALLARFGFVRLLLTLLSGGATAAPRQVSRMFGRKAAALMEHMVGEVQKLPPHVLPYVQAHWSHPKAFRGMRQHLAAMPSCSADLMRASDAFGQIPVIVLSAGDRDARWLAEDAALAAASSRGRHIVSAGSGHWIHLDDPELVIGTINEVLAMARNDR